MLQAAAEVEAELTQSFTEAPAAPAFLEVIIAIKKCECLLVLIITLLCTLRCRFVRCICQFCSAHMAPADDAICLLKSIDHQRMHTSIAELLDVFDKGHVPRCAPKFLGI